MIKVGLIDCYLDQYHAHHYPGWIREASGGEIRVTSAWAEADKPGGKSNADCCRQLGIPLLDSMEAVVEGSDCLIVMSPDHPERHEDLCRLALRSGKPTYVDKTFAPDRASAQRLIAMAEESATPFFSTSALRYAAEYADIPRDGIDFIASRGPGQFENYGIHQLEPMICLMGAALEKIMSVGTPATPSFVLRYRDGRSATMAQLGQECDFGLAIHYRDGHALVIQGATDLYRQFILRLVEFFRDGIPKVPAAETLQVITILEYGKKALEAPDTWISLP